MSREETARPAASGSGPIPSRPPRGIDGPLLAELPLPEHGREASKADRGKLLIVAGSTSLPGAAILAARAALRVGCGTVRVAAPRSVAVAIGVALPELMVLPLPETAAGTLAEAGVPHLEEQWESCDAAVIGPGLGSHEETDRLTTRFVAGSPLPTVVDAGALLAWGRAGRPPAPGPRVLTPHAGEMSRLIGREPDEVEDDREAIAARFAREWDSVLVLKGPRTLVAGRGLYLNTAGTPGLGTAGSGDVLAGVIGGLLARGSDPTASAVWGVHIHALAGEFAAEEQGDDGMIASDIVASLPAATRALHRD
jgi:hydroxyethylthiazole kinase-like uncharacterized protein yjeF